MDTRGHHGDPIIAGTRGQDYDDIDTPTHNTQATEACLKSVTGGSRSVRVF